MRNCHRNWKRIWAVILAIFVILWTCFIFAQSAKNSEESTDDTDKVIGIIDKIAGFFGEDAEISSHFIRKAAHFIEYAILGTLASLLFLMAGGGWRLIGSFLYSVSVAFCDEFAVQRFSEGRAPQFTDVLIDAGGALAGLLLVFVFFAMIVKKGKKP